MTSHRESYHVDGRNPKKFGSVLVKKSLLAPVSLSESFLCVRSTDSAQGSSSVLFVGTLDILCQAPPLTLFLWIFSLSSPFYWFWGLTVFLSLFRFLVICSRPVSKLAFLPRIFNVYGMRGEKSPKALKPCFQSFFIFFLILILMFSSSELPTMCDSGKF